MSVLGTFLGGTPVSKDAELLKDKSKCPHIVVAAPGCLNALVRDKVLDAKKRQAFRVGQVRQDARTARLVTQLQTRTPPSTSRSTSSRAQWTSRQRKPRFFFSYSPICSLSLDCSVSGFYLTSTSPTRHAPRRSRDLPRHTPSQASNDVQCHVGEGHPGYMQKVYG
jgi:hypothetical protein